jgi:hypothetical protein
MLEHQKKFLPGVLRGKYVLNTCCHGNVHLVLIDDRDHAFCGEKLPSGWSRSWHRFESGGFPVQVCELCKETFNRLVKELPPDTEVA